MVEIIIIINTDLVSNEFKGTGCIWRCFYHFYKGNNFCEFVFVFLQGPSENRSTLKENTSRSNWERILSLKLYPFSKGMKN